MTEDAALALKMEAHIDAEQRRRRNLDEKSGQELALLKEKLNVSRGQAALAEREATDLAGAHKDLSIMGERRSPHLKTTSFLYVLWLFVP